MMTNFWPNSQNSIISFEFLGKNLSNFVAFSEYPNFTPRFENSTTRIAIFHSTVAEKSHVELKMFV